MMPLGGWWSRGAEAAGQTQTVEGPQWVYGSQAQVQQVIPPRARGNDVWVQYGDLRSSVRTADTWEGEAT